VRRPPAMSNRRRPPAETPSPAQLGREELVPMAPLPQPPAFAPRRRPPAIDRQRASAVAEQLMVRAPPPRLPV